MNDNTYLHSRIEELQGKVISVNTDNEALLKEVKRLREVCKAYEQSQKQLEESQRRLEESQKRLEESQKRLDEIQKVLSQ